MIARPPGEGERQARRGLVHQDRASARLVYEALVERRLRWIGLADRNAGVADDFVLGLNDFVVAHQFKKSDAPSAIGLTALLLGTGSAIAKLADSYHTLKQQFPQGSVSLRYLTNDYPSTHDKLITGDTTSSTAAFLAEWAAHPIRTLVEWQATSWRPLVDKLAAASKLTESEFEEFWRNFDLVMGPDASPVLDPGEDDRRRAQVEELARALSVLVVDDSNKDRWSRAELLEALGWPDRYGLRFTHAFPIGAYVQRNNVTEARLVEAIAANTRGYVSLVGPPGAGKSTLLQRELRERPGLYIARYLAFVPGTAQGQGRGEADSFYDDLNAQLAATGLTPLRWRDDSTWARQQVFDHLLMQAGERHTKHGTRYVIVVDGLDHVPREEHPDRSLLSVLPLPQSVPDGVTFVLGTQRLDLRDMPAAVSDEAGASGRRVEIAPLSEHAVSAMADALGLPQDISREDVYRMTAGHPLVTRYLIERLIRAEPNMREQLLGGKTGFDGDLETVYQAAWRGVEQAENSQAVKQVLALVAHAEGPIEPEFLASATSDEAVETALEEAGHLLNTSIIGWSVFHNSFRLFVREKPILRFGAPDARFSSEELYRKLADLAREASPQSPQRWLRFRYLYLASDIDEALTLVERSYFVDQFCAGRSARAVSGDISDAFRALKGRTNAEKLFDLMLANDEVVRRATIMEGATSLVDAYLAVGSIDAARAALVDSPEEGKQWLVMDALLEAGEIEQARQLFEAQSPFRAESQDDHSGAQVDPQMAFQWAEHAILFLDEEQLERYVSEAVSTQSISADQIQKQEDNVRAIKFQIGRALVRANSEVDIQSVAQRWDAQADSYLILLLEAAESAFDRGAQERTRCLLTQVAQHEALDRLPPSWPRAAAKLAAEIVEHELAKHFLQHAPLESLDAIEKWHWNERLVPACQALVDGVAMRIAIGVEVPALSLPDERLLRGVQHQLVSLGTAIGSVLAGRAVGEVGVARAWRAAIHFLATARAGAGADDEVFIGYLMPGVADVIAESINYLVCRARAESSGPARLVDELVETDRAVFRWWPSFRRLVAIGTFRQDGDAGAALTRLEAGLADVTASDTIEEIKERTAYAAGIAQVGATDRATSILAELRQLALGVYLPAKKDGQYELWTDTLARANNADPGARAIRAATALRFTDGLAQTEAYDMAGRIAREVLFEAAASDPTTAWNAAKWAAGTGAISWDGIIDATLRGVLVRQPTLAHAVLIAWAHLCLPWYAEPHGSTTSYGQFLEDLISTAHSSEVVRLENAAAEAIGALALPDKRLVLLGKLEGAAKQRGGGEQARAAYLQWNVDPPQDEDIDTERRSYHHLVDLAGVAKAVASELAYHDQRQHADSTYSPFSRISYELRKAAARIIAVSNWWEADAFVQEHSLLRAEPEVAIALARTAIAADRFDEARAIVAPFLDPDAEGWSWPLGHGRLRYHQLRHLLQEPGVFEMACSDFIGDLAAGQFGTRNALWSIGEVFPVLFEEVPWPELWNLLAAQIESMREFRLGRLVPVTAQVADDCALIAEVFAWGLTLGVPLLHAEAARGAIALLAIGNEPIFHAVVDRLLGADGEALMIGIDLLTSVVDRRSLKGQFDSHLIELVDHPDVGVAAAASFLCERWGIGVKPKTKDLPAFYRLQLPQFENVFGNAASNTQTGDMVIDEPLGWTEGWEELAQRIARDANLSTIHVRRRVGQLIYSWGGVKRYGHAGSKRLEADIEKIDLKLTYRRPQAEATLRAFRYVVGEVWRAGLLSHGDWRLILPKLRADPDKPVLPSPQARPANVRRPLVKRIMSPKEQRGWLDAVSSDLEFAPIDIELHLLAEWRRTVIRHIRVTAISEQWRSCGKVESVPATLEAFFGELPRVLRIASPIPLYDTDAIHSSKTCSKARDFAPV